jgi:hypothetical protein
MGGLVLDIVVAYLYKSCVRIFEYVESARWKRTTASIVESSVVDPGIGCTVVKIRYQVDAEDKTWVEEEEIPFLSRRDARRFAVTFAPNRKVTVRVHPDSSTITRFYGIGQKMT